MIMIEYDNYLAHYGVEGMKWGVRKNRSSRTQKLYDRAVALSNQVSQSAQTGDHVSRFQKRYMRQIDSVQRLAQNNNSALVKKTNAGAFATQNALRQSQQMHMDAVRAFNHQNMLYNQNLMQTQHMTNMMHQTTMSSINMMHHF